MIPWTLSCFAYLCGNTGQEWRLGAVPSAFWRAGAGCCPVHVLLGGL